MENQAKKLEEYDFETRAAIYSVYPEAVLSTKEFADLVKEVVISIGQATRRAARYLGAKAMQFFRHLAKENAKAIEIHRRLRIAQDERYSNNYFYLRGQF